MSQADLTRTGNTQARRLLGLYTRTMVWYLLAVMLLWLAGIEAIYGHPTPFYALYFPAFNSAAVPIATVLGAIILYALLRRIMTRQWPSPRWLLPVIAGLALALLILLNQERAGADQTLFATLGDFFERFRWHLLLLTVCAAGVAALFTYMQNTDWLQKNPTRRESVRWLLGVCVFYVVFACAVAMIRNGPEGIAQAYSRQTYEYIGDIGKTRNIHDLFARYLEIHPYLSMHAKVHPPGPIALLWLMSYVVTQSVMALSLATILFGSLALVPLYYWAKDLAGAPVARGATLLYGLAPSIVLFTATSADILFAPFTITTLFLFDRALGRNSSKYAIAAGAGFAAMSLLKFSLIAIGAYFALVGLWMLRDRMHWTAVVKTAVLMLAAFLAVHAAVYLWSGFDMIGAFQSAKAQFDLDQAHLDELSPRFPAWSWRILNPVAWFFFAGIPVSVLFIWRLIERKHPLQARWWIFFATLVALNFLYLARGEGERSALYIIPFLVLPAAHLLQDIAEKHRSPAPLVATLGFLAFQCWLIESYFYTYW